MRNNLKARTEKNNGYLYVIKPGSEPSSSIFDALVIHLQQAGFLNNFEKSIVFKHNAIYFRHNLNEISAFISEFLPLILDFKKAGEPISLDEETVFEKKFIQEKAGIVFERCEEPVSVKRRNKIREAKHDLQNLDFDSISDNKITEISGNSASSAKAHLLKGISEHQGVCIGETHSKVLHKKFLVTSMPSFAASGIKQLFVELGFYDTQTALYEKFFQTGLLPKALLAELIRQDISNRIIVGKNSDDFLYSYRTNPYSSLGIVVMAQMLGIHITPIDTTEAYDGITGYAKKNETKFSKKRALAMNLTAAEIISQSREKYFALVGAHHNISMKELRAPGVSALLSIPNLDLRDITVMDIEEDPFIRASLIYNIHRVLMGKPIKPLQVISPAPQNYLDCFKLIYLTGLKREIKQFSNEPRLAWYQKKLEKLDFLKKIDDIYHLFEDIMLKLEDEVNEYKEASAQTASKIFPFLLEKYLEGEDLRGSEVRETKFPETIPLLLNAPDYSKTHEEFYSYKGADNHEAVERIKHIYDDYVSKFTAVQLSTMDKKQKFLEIGELKIEFIDLIKFFTKNWNQDDKTQLFNFMRKWENQKTFLTYHRDNKFYNLFTAPNTWNEVKEILKGDSGLGSYFRPQYK
ncbi:type III effector HopAC1 [Legionella qingyii]|uniref:Type III effector HopAC1 n=1 Tax=Legionella qingyii TaxID=2184757 RepID=A0A317U4A6_9GAMM|nr:membrane-targeted effector domain-containing toxin [Legionella qingyii]PWY55372.1 type III effector HopAC1 [Legionella qingyii]RUR21226.1 type III effector HopAC1 [Legionella qingyii]RUR23984.1 type III effector HopAC1 [Legionella qingyii]